MSAGRHRAGPGALLGALGELVDLALARECGGCGTAGTRWCDACAAELLGPLLLRELPGDLPGDLPVWSVCAYDGVVREAVVAWKDRDRADLTAPFAGALLRAAVAASGALAGAGHPLMVLPAPSSPAARRTRGRQPVRELSRRTAAGLRRRGVPAQLLPVLRQRRAVADQAGLGSTERAQNLAGALWLPRAWRAQLRGRRCLLVDDVVTTGATLQEAARVLAEAGAGPIAAVTVAATMLRRAAIR